MAPSTQMNEQFYDGMADHYHLIFEDCAVGKSSGPPRGLRPAVQ